VNLVEGATSVEVNSCATFTL